MLRKISSVSKAKMINLPTNNKKLDIIHIQMSNTYFCLEATLQIRTFEQWHFFIFPLDNFFLFLFDQEESTRRKHDMAKLGQKVAPSVVKCYPGNFYCLISGDCLASHFHLAGFDFNLSSPSK